ncbi:uncharacterized protein LOC114263666 [Camellia sinensis]|uniref:uncharacterized protein LOC114263666 n=1 Tax=Camellia sinensis TaxID=4442 RepID=UPI0010369188|nr:uncharacterized protein LOC114263666 [Camellia sinensis]
MTCNPYWPKIKAKLHEIEEAQNRPNLIARVFRAKIMELKNELVKKQLFGPITAYTYVIEYQKYGLPHVHFLLVLKSHAKIIHLEEYDTYISAEVPNKDDNPHLYKVVVKHMMRGPCGALKPTNPCMTKKGECKNKYPQEFSEVTMCSENSYPIYRRRNDGKCVNVQGSLLDNKWVVPYNPYLLIKFNCHINVEICSTIKAEKYFYKYVYRGHDRVSFHFIANDNGSIIDEISAYQSARWISPPEAAWHIYKFTFNNISSTVLALHLHLSNMQLVNFKEKDNLPSVLQFGRASRTMLTEYFATNKANTSTRQWLYSEFPEHYVWNVQDRYWKPRQRSGTIGRIVLANPSEGK